MNKGYRFMRENKWIEAIEQLELFNSNLLVFHFALSLNNIVAKHGIKKVIVNFSQNNMKILLRGYLERIYTYNKLVIIKFSLLILIMWVH